MPVKKRQTQSIATPSTKKPAPCLSFYQERKIRQFAEIYREKAAVINPQYNLQFLAELIDDAIINNREQINSSDWGQYLLMNFDHRISLVKDTIIFGDQNDR